jgi:flagellar M-ring protein FliF
LVFAAIFSFAHWNKERDFKPLYSGLSAEDAGAIVAKLKETGTEFRLGEGNSTVLVPSDRVPELRLQMAKDEFRNNGLCRAGQLSPGD